MNHEYVMHVPARLALELFQPRPNVFYDLDETAHLAGITRRALLVYWRAGLVRPVFQPPYGRVEFTNETILTVRRLERLREAHGLDAALLTTVARLLDEVDRLRNEVRFLRMQ